MKNTLPDGIPTKPLNFDQEQLLARHKDDEEARTMLVMHSIHEAIPYLCTVSKNKVPADELLSLSYTGLTKAAQNFNPGGLRFFAYAKVYLRSEISKWWKQQDAVRNASLHEDKGKPSEALAADVEVRGIEEPPYEEIDLKERWELVQPLLASELTDRERMVVELTYLSGFTLTKISKMVVPQCSREAVRQVKLHALKKLHLALAKKHALL